MAPPTRSAQALSLVELLVVIAVIFVLAILFGLTPGHSNALHKGQLIQALSNGRQIHQATMTMAIDGANNADPSLGWPGDLKARGRIASVEDYVNVLVRNDYFKAGDLKIFATAGIKAYPGGTLSSGSNGVITPAFAEENNAYKVFLVNKDDSANTVFLTTKNYTYNQPLNDRNAKPFGDKGFVVIRKGGDGSVLKKQSAQNLEIVGKLPRGATVESAENCLNPGRPAR